MYTPYQAVKAVKAVPQEVKRYISESTALEKAGLALGATAVATCAWFWGDLFINNLPDAGTYADAGDQYMTDAYSQLGLMSVAEGRDIHAEVMGEISPQESFYSAGDAYDIAAAANDEGLTNYWIGLGAFSVAAASSAAATTRPR
jgi:hypothetical protein